MEDYCYVLINKNGKRIKGTMEAASEEDVLSVLRSEGSIPISVVPQGIMNKDLNFSFGKPVKPRELSVFCRQFGSILSASVTIVNALEMLSKQSENKVLSKAIRDVKTSVEKGETLAGALGNYPKIFPSILVNMVEAGEASGNLEISFERMAVHFEKEAGMKSQVKKAMIYPAVIAIVSVVVIFIMMLVVIPNFVGMFDSMNIGMPLMTRLVIGISNFFIKGWYMILGVLGLVILALRIYKNTPDGKLFFGRLGLKLPLFGKLTVKSASSRFSRTLSTLLSTGIPMMDALDITARTMDNMVIKQVLLGAKEEVAKGLPLSIPITSSGVFPAMVCDMTRIGEETGNLDRLLNKLADYYDEEVKAATDALMAAMEPMIIVLLALFVGILIMAIMQPMLTMYKSLGSGGM